MPTFEVQGRKVELSAAELAKAPKSVLSEVAALAESSTEAIKLSTWPEPDGAVFKVGL